MPGGFYFQWKYPNTSRRLTKFFFILLIIYLPIYFFFIASPKNKVHLNDLQAIHGSVEYFEIPSANDKQIAILKLREYIDKQFSFDMSGYIKPEKINNGDSVAVFASATDLQNNSINISSYELRNGNDLLFSLVAYNSELDDNALIERVFLWIAIIYIILYLIIERTGLFKWIEKQMASPDPNFKPNEPNFNEFLDR